MTRADVREMNSVMRRRLSARALPNAHRVMASGVVVGMVADGVAGACVVQCCMFRLLLRVIRRCADSAAGRCPACSAFIYFLQVEGFRLKLQQVQVHLNVSR